MSHGEVEPILMEIDEGRLAAVLKWLDVSGLALYFLNECKRRSLISQIAPELRYELEEKAERNKLRVDAQLQQLSEVVKCLREDEVPFAVRKGFSLTPEYCLCPYLRHQIDLDLVVSTNELSRAVNLIQGIGYSIHNQTDQEVGLIAEPVGGPQQWSDIYALRERRVELHTSLYEVPLEQQSERVRFKRSDVRMQRLFDVEFPALHRDTVLIGQFYHALHHLRVWLRLSWLWELHYFFSNVREEYCWASLSKEIGRDPLQERGVAIVLALLRHTFDTVLPEPLTEIIRKIPSRLISWASGPCDDFLLSEQINIGCPVFLALSMDTNLARTAFTKRITQPFRYLADTGDMTLRSDLSRVRRLFAWYLRG